MNKKKDLISNSGSKGSRGISSISTHKERKYHTIPFRLDFIKDILIENQLEPIINFNNLETEDFVHPNGYQSSKEGSIMGDNDSRSNSFGGSLDSNNDSKATLYSTNSESHDIRQILDKKKYDFYKIIENLIQPRRLLWQLILI